MAPTSMGTLRDLEDVVRNTEANASTAQKFLHAVRQLKVRRSELVVKCGRQLLTSKKLSAEELWLVHEQVCVAALDIHDVKLAMECIKKLNAKFPDSTRVGRLRGMALESEGKWEQAATVYDRLLDKNPNNAPVLKRKAAMERARGNPEAAVEQLNAYLATFMFDLDAWAELADIYLVQGMYQQAAFCQEELITGAPHNYLHHLRYAETLYTLGGAENLRTARKYFAAAVELTEGGSTRALYGLWVCSAAVAAIKGAKLPDDESELQGLAADRLVAMYRDRNPAKASLVQKMVDAAR